MFVFHEYWAHINYNGRSIIFQLVHFIRYNGAISSSKVAKFDKIDTNL